MYYQLGAVVERPDGGKLGEIERIVYDPGTQGVTALVVRHNTMDNREVIVPIGVVNDADDQTVVLDVSEETFDSFDDYSIDRNLAPPPGLDVVPSDDDEPNDVPVGFTSGVEGVAYTPIIEERTNVAPSLMVLDGETHVWATDRDLGHLKQIRVDDETGRVIYLIVERGGIFLHDTEVPVDTIADVQPGSIILSVPADGLADGEA